MQMPPSQPGWYRRISNTSRVLLILSFSLALVAVLAFLYVLLFFLAEQGSLLQLAMNAVPSFKIAAIGFASFFLSFLLALGALMVEWL